MARNPLGSECHGTHWPDSAGGSRCSSGRPTPFSPAPLARVSRTLESARGAGAGRDLGVGRGLVGFSRKGLVPLGGPRRGGSRGPQRSFPTCSSRGGFETLGHSHLPSLGPVGPQQQAAARVSLAGPRESVF
ncbi:uncharacterized protein LOC125133872 [Phacochoerus africanus]|uniref:uncharacterized protein LOC125133872 n=1 Tax=Phacochoerus africanus TaxID=41426 RepID=UPI001FD97F79|nr:uncharacterized protein LOC125133872 [Phacochoerus africanus]